MRFNTYRGASAQQGDCSQRHHTGPCSQALGFVYVVESCGLFRIGESIQIRRRLRDHRLNSAAPVRRIASAVVGCQEQAKAVERYLHKLYAAQCDHGSWFALEPFQVNDVSNYLRAPSINIQRRRRCVRASTRRDVAALALAENSVGSQSFLVPFEPADGAVK